MGSYGGSVLDPILKGMQLRQMLDDIKFRKELRERQKQEFDLDLQDRKRRQAMEDFKIAITLEQMNALPVRPGIEGKFEAGLGGRGTLMTPSGQQVSLPNPEQKFQRSLLEAQQEGMRRGVAGRAEQDIENPYVTTQADTGLPAPFNVGRRQMREKDAAALERIRATQQVKPDPQPHFERIVNAETGDVTVDTYDREGRLKTSTTRPGLAGKKPASEAAMSAAARRLAERRVDAEYTGQHRQQMINDRAAGLYQTYAQEEGIDWQYEQEAAGKATQKLSDGTEFPIAANTDKARHIAQVKARARQEAEKIVNADLEALKAKYTDEELSKGASSTSTASPAAKATKTAGRVPVLKAANVAEAARRKGMTPEQFRSWFGQQGGVIQ